MYLLADKNLVANSDLGVHVDGYVALVATTLVVGQSTVTGRAADAIIAAKTAADVIIRCLKQGTSCLHLHFVLNTAPFSFFSF